MSPVMDPSDWSPFLYISRTTLVLEPDPLHGEEGMCLTLSTRNKVCYTLLPFLPLVQHYAFLAEHQAGIHSSVHSHLASFPGALGNWGEERLVSTVRACAAPQVFVGTWKLLLY